MTFIGLKEMHPCSIGIFTKTECCLQPYGKFNVERDILLLSDVNGLDIIPHIKTLQLYTTFTEKCPNINESWVIRQRLDLDFSGEITICPKHRTLYGVAWKPPNLCSYPSHKKKKKKLKIRAIPPHTLLEIKKLFSSPAKMVFVPFGSKWCDNCRKFSHKTLCQNNPHIIKMLNSFDCPACCSFHDNDNLQDQPLVTPSKK